MTETTPSFSNKQNAIRAARKSLGGEAKEGVDFTLEALAGGRFAWRPTLATEGQGGPVAAADAADGADTAAGDDLGIPGFLRRQKAAEAAPSRPARGNRADGDGAESDREARILRILAEHELEPTDALIDALGAAWAAGAESAAAGRRARKPAGERKPREGNKRELVAGLLTRPEGTTTREILDATGWPAVSVPAVAKASGLELRKEKVDGVTRYYGKAA